MKGILYLIPLCKLKLLPNSCKNRLLITRSKKTITGVTWYPQLAPSKELFKTYLTEWKKGKVKNWWDLYTTRFIAELFKEPKWTAMEKLYNTLSNGTDIALICFCTNKCCHRYIIADVMKILNIKVKEIL